MSQVRCVFTLGQDRATLRSAGNIGKRFYSDEVEIRDFTHESSLCGLDRSDLHKVVMLAHGSASTYGEFSADEFAQLFLDRYNAAFAHVDKSQVRDLYLIGCDMGLIGGDGKSLAQDIIDALEKRGFHHAVLHCVARPANAEGDVLYVEVINCTGAAGLVTLTAALSHQDQPHGIKNGYLKAYLLSAQDAKRLEELENAKYINHRAVSKIKHENAFVFVNYVDPELELNKPHNIFYPRETPQNRKLRIERDTVRHYSAGHAEAIALLVHHRDFLEQKSKIGRPLICGRLDFLVDQLRLASDEHWPYVVRDYERYLKNHILFGTYLQRDKRTAQLLSALGKQEMKAANKILDDEHGVKAPTFFQRLMTDNAKPSYQDKPAVTHELPKQLREAAAQLARDLKAEISQLNSNLFSCFLFFKIRTKTAKLEIVNRILNSEDLVTAKQQARAAMGDERVIAGVFSCRTKSFLQAVDEYQPAQAVNQVLSM